MNPASEQDMTTLKIRSVFIASIAWLVSGSPLMASDMRPQPGDVQAEAPSYSPYAGREFPTNVYFGDTHLHTAISVDAGTMNRVGCAEENSVEHQEDAGE